MLTKRISLLLASVSLPMLPVMPSAASAQDVAAEEAPGDEEIIVTARRVNETLQDIPASITVFSAETLERANIQRAEDFVQFTPGVTIVTSTAEAGDTQINIRGINGARDAESSVALVVDGILKTNTAALNQNQGTLRQIEILKGPQGALYGRNAAAGAIVIQTQRPTDVLSGSVEASYANENSVTGNAYIAGPLGAGVGFVLSGDYRTTDGFYRNLLTGKKQIDDQEAWGVDGRITAELGDDTELDFKTRYSKLSGASINFNAAFHLPEFAAFNPAFNENVNDHPFRYYNNIRPTNDQETIEASIKLDHDFGPVTLTAWALYSNIKNDLVADGTSADFARYAGEPTCIASVGSLTGFPVNQPGFIGTTSTPFLFDPTNGSTFGPYSPTTCDGTQYQKRNQKDYSAEIRLASNGDNVIDWQLGGYILHIDRTVGVSLGADLGQGVIKRLYNGPASSNPTSQLFADKFKTDVYAVFGSADWEVAQKLDLGVALRYDVEKRKVRSLVPNATDPFTGGPINPGQAFGPITPKNDSFKQLQPKLTLNWEVGPRTNIFANWGIGFKSGGFNNQGSAAIVNQNFNDGVTPGTIDADVVITDDFRKERSSAFEAGIKGRAGPVNYNLTGYYTRITDMQFFEFFVGGFGLLRVVSNIDRVDVKGFEISADTSIVEGWTVYGAFNYTDSEIKKNASRPYTVGNKSPYTADYTINAGTQIEIPATDSTDIVFRADYRYTGPTWFHSVQDQTRPTIFSGLIPISAVDFLPASFGDARYDVARRRAFGVLDLRLGLEGENWKVTAFANNFLDEKYIAEAITAVEFGGSFVSPGARRLWGIEVGYKF